MHCPFCRHVDSRVIDSRTADDGATIRRRRQCPACHRRFTTSETATLTVIKRSGVTEPFSRTKVVTGVRKACQGRPVSDDDLAVLAQQVEEHMRASGLAQIEAHEVGLAILGPLRRLDEIAYLRFASVYQGFETLDDFADAIALLRAERDIDGRGGADPEPADPEPAQHEPGQLEQDLHDIPAGAGVRGEHTPDNPTTRPHEADHSQTMSRQGGSST